MANGINNCMFCGNLGSDPEYRITSEGTQILRFSIACSEYRKNAPHNHEHVEWIRIVVWGNRAKGLSKFLAKGHTVTVVGKMHTNKYRDRDGNDRYSTEIYANEVVVGSGGGGSSRGGGGRGRRNNDDRATRRPQNDPPQDSGSYPDQDYGPNDEDDDIPF